MCRKAIDAAITYKIKQHILKATLVGLREEKATFMLKVMVKNIPIIEIAVHVCCGFQYCNVH